MSAPRRRFAFVLARRFARGRRVARSSALVGACAAFLVVTYLALQALTLSPEQTVDQELGRSEVSVGLGAVRTVEPGDPDPAPALLAAARGAGATRVAVELTTPDVQVTEPAVGRVFFVERPWSATAAPPRYRLRSGRWPSRPGEVAVTDTQLAATGRDGRLGLFSDRAEVRVVGRVDDEYSRQPTLLAAAGTWSTFDPALERDFAGIAAFPTVFADGVTGERLVDAVLPTRLPEGQTPDQVRAALTDATTTAESLRGSASPSWSERVPAGYLAPAVILPPLAILLMFGLNHRWARRRLEILTAAGLPRSTGALGLALAMLRWIVLAALGGVAVGVLVGAAIRPILASANDLPLSPFTAPLGAVGQLLLTLLAAWAVLTADLVVGRGGRSGARRPSSPATPSGRRRTIRHGAALVATCAVVLQVPEVDTPARAMVLAATTSIAVLLLAPDVVAWALRRISEAGPIRKLARRQLLHDRRRAAMATVALAAGIGLPLGFLTLLQTSIDTAEAVVDTNVRPGQLALADVGGVFVAPSPVVVDAAERALGPQSRSFRLRLLNTDRTTVYLGGSQDGFVVAVDSADQAAALLDRPLSADQTRALGAGGMLTWDSSQPTQRLVPVSGTRAGSAATVRSARAASPEVAWATGTRGLILTASARRLGLPVSTGAVIFPGVSSEQTAAVRRAVLAAGLDGEQVLTYEAQEPVVPPVAFVATAVALAALSLCITFVITRAQVAALRDYAGTLLAVGLPPTWTRRVLHAQQALLLGVAIVLALALAVPPVVLSAWQLPGFRFSVPWGWLGGLLVVVVAVAALTSTVAGRSLRPQARAGG